MFFSWPFAFDSLICRTVGVDWRRVRAAAAQEREAEVCATAGSLGGGGGYVGVANATSLRTQRQNTAPIET